MNQKTIIRVSMFMILLLGTCMMAQAQDKKIMIIEVTNFKVKPEVKPEKFVERDRKIQKDYTANQSGFIKRLSGVNEKGEWVVIVYWKTMRDANASMNKFMSDQSVADYAAMIDGSTMKMNRYISN